MILEKACEYEVDIHQLYIDCKRAYDILNRAELVEIMKEFGIPMKLVRLVKMTLANTISKAKIQGNCHIVLKQRLDCAKEIRYLLFYLIYAWKR
jgi:hypothetical protein